MNERAEHALVLGGSMAGLLAARTLSDHYRRVTIIERDALPPGSELRKGAPQARHSHGLLASGLRALESMFPGFTAGALERGGLTSDSGDFCDWYIGGVAARRAQSGVRGLLFSRLALESYVRELVLARDNVQVEGGQSVVGLLSDARRVTGVYAVASSGAREP